MTLIERYLDRPASTRQASRGAVLAALAVVLLVTVGTVTIAVWLVRLLLSL